LIALANPAARRAEDRTRALDLLAKACAGGHGAACGLRTQIESMRR
jgi:hypothetical protein